MNGKSFPIVVSGAVAALLLLARHAGAFSQSPSSIVWAPMSPVHFRSGSARLDGEARRILASYARLATDNPKTHLIIDGYSDTVGTTAANLQLSEKRAMAVKSHLTLLGVRPEQMTAAGRGEVESFTGARDSRRVEIDVLMAGTTIFDAVPFTKQSQVPLVIHLPDDEPRTLHIRVIASDSSPTEPLAEIGLGPDDPRMLRPPRMIHIDDLVRLFAFSHARQVRIEVRISPEALYWPVIGVTGDRGRVEQRFMPK